MQHERAKKQIDDGQSMMTHVLKTGKTNPMGESKAKQRTGLAQDRNSFPPSNKLTTEKQ